MARSFLDSVRPRAARCPRGPVEPEDLRLNALRPSRALVIGHLVKGALVRRGDLVGCSTPCSADKMYHAQRAPRRTRACRGTAARQRARERAGRSALQLCRRPTPHERPWSIRGRPLVPACCRRGVRSLLWSLRATQLADRCQCSTGARSRRRVLLSARAVAGGRVEGVVVEAVSGAGWRDDPPVGDTYQDGSRSCHPCATPSGQYRRH